MGHLHIYTHNRHCLCSKKGVNLCLPVFTFYTVYILYIFVCVYVCGRVELCLGFLCVLWPYMCTADMCFFRLCVRVSISHNSLLFKGNIQDSVFYFLLFSFYSPFCVE